MQTTIQYIKKELEGVYPESEIQGLTGIILEWATGWNYTQQMFNREQNLKDILQRNVVQVVARLKRHEPIQYILGETEFYGLKIKVRPNVLIPRPETEELVHFVLEKNQNSNVRILDIGTGSGCIALALKNKLKNAKVYGMDISTSALEIASENARLNQLQVEFIKADILQWKDYDWKKYDIIVSNPPYVRKSEKLQMQRNVLDYEPENALFVSDEYPLIFYRAITEMAKKQLAQEGQLFFEINENMAGEMHNLLLSYGLTNIEIKRDINNKNRMISCRK